MSDNFQKDNLLSIFRLLVSDKAEGDIAVKNDMEFTPMDLAKQVRNPRDRKALVEMLTKTQDRIRE